jgi:ATP-binding cassette subfamily B (MDR/TAP) protein 1
VGAVLFGSFNPLLAFFIIQVVQNYQPDGSKKEVNKWCLVIAGMSIVTVIANFLQHFYFGIMGEKMTERVRRQMFSGEIHSF